MNAVWFVTLAAMLAAYAALDGYDLGVGALHWWIARGNDERRVVMNSIGPVWNGNEVWLIAAGGMLVVSFPRLYAAAFSGFYLAIMLVLWLLILRGVSIEFRGQVGHDLWRDLWDAGFWTGSLLLAFLLGVALGNVLRGLPIGAAGNFQGTFTLLLNSYALLTGLLSLTVLCWHGLNYLRVKSEGELLARARRWSWRCRWLALAFTLAATAATFALRAGIGANFRRAPWTLALPALVAFAFFWSRRRDDDRGDHRAFAASTLAIVGLLGTAAATLFPTLLPSTENRAYDLTIYNTAASHHALVTSFAANMVGLLAVVLYSGYVHRIFHGKVRLSAHY